MQRTQTIDYAVLDYLFEKGVPSDPGAMINGLIGRKPLGTVIALVQKLEKLPASVAVEVMTRYVLFLEDVKILVAAVEKYGQKSFAKSLQKKMLELVIAGHYEVNPLNDRRGTFLRLAWKFGNEDNYFKLLPRELIEHICSYNLDKPDWWESAEYLISNSDPIDQKLEIFKEYVGLTRPAPFVWQNWDLFLIPVITQITSQLLEGIPLLNLEHPNKVKTALDWCQKFIRRQNSVVVLNGSSSADLVYFCMTNEFAVSLYHTMMEHGGNTFWTLFGPDSTIFGKPAYWFAAIENNRPMLQYLAEIGHLDFDDNALKELEQLLMAEEKDTAVVAFIRQILGQEVDQQ